MAPEQSTVSTSASPFNATLSTPATATPIPITQLDSDAVRSKSLKRSRPEPSQNPSNLTSIASAGLGASPSPKSPRFAGSFSPGFSPAPLTGAAAIADERRRREEAQRGQPAAMSENPGHAALASLMSGGGTGMSKPQDAPVATTAMSAGMTTAANAITIPNSMDFEEKPETSPASVTSLASLGSTAQTVTASSTAVASPAQMLPAAEEVREMRTGGSQQHLLAPLDEQSNRALSYPGNAMGQINPPRVAARGASLPMPAQNQPIAPRSPSQKKHKCPYCETEFTRHHNLKSHLLTHSQEKPYVCQTCTMRFRRLHDLKRHMKLHTGERPHICPKCDRKFARGDALARHSKGNGGCAGRRASMGSFGGEEDFDGSNAGEGEDGGMDGVLYTNGNPHNEPEMTEEDRRRFSLPSIKAQHVAGSHSSQDNYPPHLRAPSTYPPAGPRPSQSQGGLYPPNTDRGTPSSSTSPSLQNNIISGHAPTANMSSAPLNTGSSMFSQGGMTESPKPLSPAGMHSHQLGHDSINRQRSPSLTTQFQQQHFGRRPSERHSPPGLAPPDTRYTLPSQISSQQHAQNVQGGQQGQQLQMPQNQMHQSQQSPISARGPHPNSQQQGSSSGDSSNNLFASGERGVWAYVQTLEDRVKQLSDKVMVMENNEKNQEESMKRLTDEVMTLRNQLNTQNQSQHQNTGGHS